MSIKDFAEKIKPFYFLFLFIVIAAIFFALGRLSAIEERHQPIKIVEPTSDETANAISAVSGEADASDGATTGATATSGEVIGSKTGKKYYFPWCGELKIIKPENQVKFASVDLAKAAGYTPGGNCKGVQ
jgi:hypothetical protein